MAGMQDFACRWTAQLNVRNEIKAKRISERLIELLGIEPLKSHLNPDNDIPGFMLVIHSVVHAESWNDAVIGGLTLMQFVSGRVELFGDIRSHTVATGHDVKCPGVVVLEIELDRR
jgi:hypothetical protein